MIYKLGFLFYVLLFTSVAFVIGCEQNKRNEIKKEAGDILNHPNICPNQE